MMMRLLIFTLLAGFATAPKPVPETPPEPECMFTHHMRLATSWFDCYCAYDLTPEAAEWVVTREEHEAREAAWQHYCSDIAATGTCMYNPSTRGKQREASYRDGTCVGETWYGPATSEGPAIYWEERVAPDGEVWSPEQVLKLHREVEDKIAKGSFAQAYDRAYKPSSRTMNPETKVLTHGLKREDYVATMELAGRAAEYLGDRQKVANLYDGLGRDFMNLGYRSPRTQLRIMTGWMQNRLISGASRVEKYATLAFELLDKIPDATPLERGRLMIAYGLSLRSESDLLAGLIQVEEGYELISSALPEYHPERIRPLLSLISFHMNAGNYEPASHYGKTLLRMLTKSVPKGQAIENPERLGWSELTQAAAVAETGQRKQAKQLSTAGIDRLRAHYGERTKDYGVALDVYSHVCLRNRDIPSAEKASTQAMELLEDDSIEFGPGSEVDILAGMARVLRAKGEKEEALKLFQRAALVASFKTRDVSRYITYTQCYLYAALKESKEDEVSERIHESAKRRAKTTLPAGNRTRKICEEGSFSGY